MRFQFLFLVLFSFFAFETYGKESESVLEFDPNSQEAKVIELKGDWEFFWKMDANEARQHPEKAQLIHVPSSWSTNEYGRTGYGTYHKRIILKEGKGRVLAIKFYSLSSAYRMYAGTKFLGSVGKFSKTEEGSSPDYHPSVFEINPESDTLDIWVEVSNYQYRQGGMWNAPYFGLLSDIMMRQTYLLIMHGALLGALLIMGMYFLAFYYTKTNEKVNLVFALLCIAGVFRVGATGEMLIRMLEIPISWEGLVRTEFIGLVFMLMFGVLYIQNLFPKDVNRKVSNTILIVNIAFTVLYLFLPIKWGSMLIPPYLVFSVAQLLYLLNLIVKVLIAKRNLAVLAAIGYFIVTGMGLNDILLSQELINSVYLTPFGIFLFTFIQAYTLTRKFSGAFSDVEHLSEKLSAINQDQERTIFERTSRLNEQAEDLRRINSVKDRIFSIVAHDLRAPIKSLGSVLNFAEDPDITIDELRKYLRGIRKNVDSLNLTLENLLVWSTNQVNGVQSVAELLDVRLIVNQKIELYQIQAEEKGIRLESLIRERYMVYIDSNHLKIILRNLISNAIKFTPPGGKIQVAANQLGETMLELSVTDSGVGMPENIIKKILVEGEMYTSYGTKNEKGTGLGLMLCKEYVEYNGGSFKIESTPGAGTKVSFTLKTQAG
ncbi:MAG: sensor histidine kinase [Bacteroidia bacterium]|nr:sensor histidine kinase [Bacteroidia bacterium]